MTQYLSLLYFTSKQTNKQKSYQGVKFYLVAFLHCYCWWVIEIGIEIK